MSTFLGKKSILTFLAIIFVAFSVQYFKDISAQTIYSKSVEGYAWSSNIGWIYFDPENVKVDMSGNVIGYAWSSNIGWLRFGNLSGFPSGGTAVNAKIENGQILGWARFVAPSTTNSGWDGWVLLSGMTHSVRVNGSNLSGYAWGDDVVGWIDFSGVFLNNENEVETNTFSCSGNVVKLENPRNASIYTASPSDATYKWYDNAQLTGTPLSTSNSYQTTFNQTDQYQRWVEITKNSVSGVAFCYSTVNCGDKPEDEVCTNGSTSRTVYGSCQSDGSWSSTSESCGTIVPPQPPVVNGTSSVNFYFSRNIVNVGETCPFFLNASNVISCSIRNRSGDTVQTINADLNTNSINISGSETNSLGIGSYTAWCSRAGTPNPIKYGNTQACYSKPTLKEN